MIENTEYFENSLGKKIFCRSWVKSKENAVLAVHGLGEHSGCYLRLAENLSATLIVIDLPGHGKSYGKRGRIKNFSDFTDDLNLVFENIKKRYSNVMLLGHSMGGLVVISYILDYNPQIQGVILSSPLLGFSYKIPKFKQTLFQLTKSLLSGITLKSGLKFNDLTRDQKVIREYMNDDLRHGLISVRLFDELQKKITYVFTKAHKYSNPSLILIGKCDKVVNIKEVERFFSKTRCNKTIKYYEDVLHEPFNDSKREQAFRDFNFWVNKLLNHG